jgi:hypothetical protein
MALKLITAPAAEPVSTSEAKSPPAGGHDGR